MGGEKLKFSHIQLEEENSWLELTKDFFKILIPLSENLKPHMLFAQQSFLSHGFQPFYYG
jgi:hypothetical protein